MNNDVIISDNFQINQHMYVENHLDDWEKVNYSLILLRFIKLEEKEREKGLPVFYNRAIQRSFPTDSSDF